MVDAEELARLLAPTVLGGRPVEDAGHGRLLVRVDPDEVWPGWQAARSVVASSGRWPVAVTSPDDPAADLVPLHAAVQAVEAADDVTDPWSAFSADASWGIAGNDERPTWEDVSWVTDQPLSEVSLRALLADGATRGDVERARYDHWLAEGIDRTEELRHLTRRETRGWYVMTDWANGIALLTTADPAAATAHVGYFPVDEQPATRRPALVAAAREWHARHGAELIAAWGTMLHFTVSRPPADAEAAWELAGRHLLLGGSLQDDRSDLAMALPDAESWFLHDRP